MLNCFSQDSNNAIPIEIIQKTKFANWLEKQSIFLQSWLKQAANKDSEQVKLIPDDKGNLVGVLVLADDVDDFWLPALIASKLPAEVYKLPSEIELNLAAIAWGANAYKFARYLADKEQNNNPQLLINDDAILRSATNVLKSIYLCRDLVNTPTEDLGPAQLADAAMQIAKQYNCQFDEIVGQQLLQENFPAVHAVGRGSNREPRLIEMRWGNTGPKVALVGKGVCFDTGGYNIKPSAGMRLMKKDMGGAAHVLAAAKLIMAENWPVQLHVLIPAVENSISGGAYKPGDVVPTRKGLSIEIDNTDAEGRVILSDALAYASEQQPDLIIDFATLTGAAKVATGTDIPAFFTNKPDFIAKLMNISEQEKDLVWPLPLHQPYRKLLDSNIASMANSAKTGFGGAITAALFLESFIGEDIPWCHFDIMAWNTSSSPGRPEGGEAMGLRTVLALIRQYVS